MRFFRLAALLLLMISATAAHFSHGAECENPARLRFSLVPEGNLERDLAALQPLFDELQRTSGIAVEVSMPSSYGSVIEGLLSGEIDFARLGPASYVSARKQDPTIIPFASPSRKMKGKQKKRDFYHSILVVRKDSPFLTIDSLRGKKILLVDPDSTSGALIPRHVFSHQVKLPIDRFFGQIGYSGSHDRSISNLLKRQADAIFVSSMALNRERKTGKGSYRILWRSEPIPRDPFVLRGNLCASIKQKIVAMFLAPDEESDKGSAKNPNPFHFVPVRDEDFQMLRELP